MGQVINLTEDQARDFAWDDVPEDFEDFEYVESTDKEIDHKWVTWGCIFLQKSTGKYFIQYNSESNSGYWSDAERDYGTALYEVEKKEVVHVEWVPVS